MKYRSNQLQNLFDMPYVMMKPLKTIHLLNFNHIKVLK